MYPLLTSNWYDDVRSRRTAELLGILWILAMADLVFTLWADRYTPFSELNPWASALLTNHRIIALTAAKILLTMLGTLILWSLRRHGVTQIAIWVVLAVYVALIFRWSNYTVQVLALGTV